MRREGRWDTDHETLIGDMETALSGKSGGCCSREALYKRPRILFLDAATSHLDVARKRRVNEAIRQFKPTRVIIAHRPETIAAADRAIDLAQENSVAMVT